MRNRIIVYVVIAVVLSASAGMFLHLSTPASFLLGAVFGAVAVLLAGGGE